MLFKQWHGRPSDWQLSFAKVRDLTVTGKRGNPRPKLRRRNLIRGSAEELLSRVVICALYVGARIATLRSNVADVGMSEVCRASRTTKGMPLILTPFVAG